MPDGPTAFPTLVDPNISASITAGVMVLLNEAERWCADRGLDEMRLHTVAESDVSNRTWAALGFGVAEHVRLRRLGP